MPIIGDQIATGTVTGANIADGTIANADINSAASIAESKLADLGKEGAASLAANIKRRGEELAYEVIPAEGITLGTGNEHKIEEASVPCAVPRTQGVVQHCWRNGRRQAAQERNSRGTECKSY